jgi:CRP-like cAMP-binding protein
MKNLVKDAGARKHKKSDGPSRIGQIRPPLAVQAFLDSAAISKQIVKYDKSATLFVQGDPCDSVMYIQAGAVRLSVLSHSGREAIVAMLGPGDFLGEGALAAQPVRIATASATTPSRILVVPKGEMVRLLREEPGFSDAFIKYMLYRNLRIEEDLVDQLFNSSEKRLARTLLLLDRYGKEKRAAGCAAEAVAGNARRNDRHHTIARELFHEQIPEARLHRVQRRPQDQHLAPQRRPPRMIHE